MQTAIHIQDQIARFDGLCRQHAEQMRRDWIVPITKILFLRVQRLFVDEQAELDRMIDDGAPVFREGSGK